MLLLFLVLAPGTLTLTAPLERLPIGTPNPVLQDAMQQVNAYSVDVELISKDGLFIEEFLSSNLFRYNSASGQDLSELIKKVLTLAVKSVNFNKPEYEGRMFQTKYTGMRYLLDKPGWYIVLGTLNEFSLVPNEKGELVVPESAYKVDLVAALMQSRGHAFFVENIERALLEVENEKGNIIRAIDSLDGFSYERESVVIYRNEVVFFPIKYVVSGQSGSITLWYTNGTKRVYRLQNGTLFPQLELARKPEGLELTVLGADDFIIESSPDLVNWGFSYLLVPLSGTPPTRFLEKSPEGNSFYRVRASEPALQKR